MAHNLGPYTACFEAFDRALNSERGVAIPFPSRAEATVFRHKCNRARVADRNRNATIYPDPEHPMHRTSEYDKIEISIAELEPGQFSVILKPYIVEVLEIKEL